MITASLRIAAILLPLTLSLAATEARAAFMGSFGVNGNVPAANPTNALATATNFTFANMSSNGNASGDFAGLPNLTIFNSTTLTLGATTGFSFSNATYGTFTQTAVAVLISQGFSGSVVTSESFRVLGNYTGGQVGTTPLAASLTISFTQTGGPGSSISSSGTVNIPPLTPGAVPEPASLVMTLTGLVGAGLVGRRRRAMA